MSLRCALARPKVNCSRISDHCQVNGRDWSAKPSVRHVTRRAGLILVRRDILVEHHKFAKRFCCFGPRILKHWRLTCENRGLQVMPPCDRSALDEIDLP